MDVTFALVILAVCLSCIFGLLNYQENHNYYYVDIYGEEKQADVCESIFTTFICYDFENDSRFLVNGYRTEEKEK